MQRRREALHVAETVLERDDRRPRVEDGRDRRRGGAGVDRLHRDGAYTGVCERREIGRRDEIAGVAIEPPARSLLRLFVHPVVGWALSAGTLLGLRELVAGGTALVLHAIATPVIFLALAIHYFRPKGAREPLTTALSWLGVVLFLDFAVVAGLMLQDFAMFTSFAGFWLPILVLFVVTWTTGAWMSTMPWPKSKDEAKRGHVILRGDTVSGSP